MRHKYWRLHASYHRIHLEFEVSAIPLAIGRAQHHLHGSSSQAKPPDQVERRKIKDFLEDTYFKGLDTDSS